jgi:hypothetical protein
VNLLQIFKETQYKSLFKLFKPREHAFKQFKCPSPQCVKSEELIGTTEYLKQQKRCHINHKHNLVQTFSCHYTLRLPCGRTLS